MRTASTALWAVFNMMQVVSPHGKRNLCGRDGEFRPTCKKIKGRSLVFRPTLCSESPDVIKFHQAAKICTRIFQNIFGVTPSRWLFHSKMHQTAHICTDIFKKISGWHSWTPVSRKRKALDEHPLSQLFRVSAVDGRTALYLCSRATRHSATSPAAAAAAGEQCAVRRSLSAARWYSSRVSSTVTKHTKKSYF